MSRENLLARSIREGVSVAKAHLPHAAILWLIAGSLFAAYTYLPGVRGAMMEVGKMKENYHPWFSIISTMIFGGIIPAVVRRVFRMGNDFNKVQFLLLMVFWGFQGILVNGLYELQSFLFGSGTDLKTLLSKVIFDQTVWVGIVAAPQVIFGFLLIEHELNIGKCLESLREKSFLERACPLIFMNWVVWIPAIFCIYLSPLPMQLPFMNVILVLWSLIIMFSQKKERASAPYSK